MNQKGLRLPVEVTFEKIDALFEQEKQKKALEAITKSESFLEHCNKMLEEVIAFADTIRNDDNQETIDELIDEKLIRKSVETNIKLTAIIEAFESYVSEQIDVAEGIQNALTEEFAIRMIEETKESVIHDLYLKGQGRFRVIPVEVQIGFFDPGEPGDPEEHYS